MKQLRFVVGMAVVLVAGASGCDCGDSSGPTPGGTGGAGGGVGGAGGFGGAGGGGGLGGAGGAGGAGGLGGAGGAGGAGGGAPEYTGDHAWSKAFTGEGEQTVRAVATDADGNVFITGDFIGTIDLGGGPLTSAGGRDIFVAQLDPAGDFVYGQSFGGAGEQLGQGIAVDAAGDAVVTGAFEGSVDFGGGLLTSAGGNDLFVVKLDRAGAHLWSRRLGDASDQLTTGPGATPGVLDVTVDSQGNALLVGTYYGTVDLGGGPLPPETLDNPVVLLAKLDPRGQPVWSRYFGSNESWQFARDIAIHEDTIFLAGSFIGTLDFGGGALDSALGADGTPPGGGGDTTLSVDGFLVKLTANGEHVWSRAIGDSGQQYVKFVEVDGSGNPIIAGNYASAFELAGTTVQVTEGYELYVASLDSNTSAPTWIKSFPLQGDQFVGGFRTDPWGNLDITGDYTGSIDFGAGPIGVSSPQGDIYVAKLDPQGDNVWTKSFTNRYLAFTNGLATGAAGEILLSGLFYNDPAVPDDDHGIDFGGEVLVHARGEFNADSFLVKLAP